MRILAVDTAADGCSAAVVSGDMLLAELVICNDQTHSRRLLKTIQFVLRSSGTDLSSVDGFAVSRGPGSFTGLRIGISMVKGFAAATGKPLVGVSTLDVLAAQAAAPSCLICPFLDARKGEVYFSRYRQTDGVLSKETDEAVASPHRALDGINDVCLFTGNGAVQYKKLIVDRLGSKAHFTSPERHVMRSSTVAFVSMDKFKTSDTSDLATFAPNYIRGADAKRPFKARLS